MRDDLTTSGVFAAPPNPPDAPPHPNPVHGTPPMTDPEDTPTPLHRPSDGEPVQEPVEPDTL